jgi:class 3 adenylate cyclase/tetratricopeptide (TPR) repeat protein
VLFCDLVGSTELSQRLDPEDLLAVTSAYQALSTEVATAHRAHIAQYLGDGAVLYFGYPHAGEDDAPRAVRCALDLVGRMAALRDRLHLEVPLAVRVGIDTGPVVVGPLRPGDRREWVAHGDVTNIAARLQAEGDPGCVVVSDASWTLVRDYFTADFLGPRRLKGVSEPVPAWCVTGATGLSERLDAVASLSPFVGRQRERALLEEAYRAAMNGATRFVLIRGDAGMGKSRLGRLLRERATSSHTPILLTRATPDGRSRPFHPVVTLLRQTLGIDRARPDDERRASLERAVTDLALDAQAVIPLLAPLLEVPAGKEYPAPELSPVRRRNQTMDAVIQVLEAIARRAPTLLVFEDLHWADASTAELLERAVDTLAGLPLLGLFAARPELDPAWGAGTPLTTIDLTRLEQPDCETLVRSVAGGKALPAPLLRELLGRAEGVPLFLEELTRSVLESGVLRERSASWEAVGPLPHDLIPTTVQPSLSARIDRLGSARSTAQLAATIGREFDYRLLRAVSDRDEPTLRRHLQRLVESGLVWESRDAGPDAYMFKHALIRDAAYESLLRTTRQQYHSRIAAALRGELKELASGRDDLIADHLTRAGEHGEAVGYWETAGREALEHTAMPEAARNFRRALECLSTLPETPERWARELELQLGVAPVLMAVYGWASTEVEQACERARTLAEQLRRPDKLYAPLWGIWSVYFLRGELGLALQAAAEVRAMAEGSGNRLLQVTGRHAMAYTLAFRGELEPALEAADSGLALFSFDQERAIANAFQFSSSVALLQSRAQALWMLGRVAQADAAVERMLQLARDLDHRPSLAAALAFALHGGGIRYWYPRQMHRLLDVAEELRRLSQDEGFHLWYTVAETYRGVIGLGLGEKGARERMIAGRELFLQTRTRITLVMMDVMIAEALHDLGDDGEAERLLAEAEAEAEAREEGLDAPEVWRVRGRVLAHRGDVSAAETAYRRSLESACGQKAHSLELRAALDLHDLLAAHGRAEEGRDHLASVFDLVPWALDRPEPARAQAILRGTVRPPSR